jgi:hypothetical protein
MSQTVKAGVARANITPAPGQMFHAGDVIAQGTRDELHVKAIVFDNGSEHAAVVTGDAILFSKETVEKARRQIEQLTDIKGENVMLAASHTHSCPPTTKWLSENASEVYLSELADKIAGLVYVADSNKREVLIAAGKGEAKVSVNRWIMTPQGARWGPDPDGAVDDDVSVLRIDDAEGGMMALLINYAAHPTVMSWGAHHLYSGDYPSYAQSVIEQVYDDKMMALFTNGASGDIKIAFLKDDGTKFDYGDWEDARRYGRIIAAEAIKVAETLEPKPITGLNIISKIVELPLCEPPSVEQVEAELAEIEQKMNKSYSWGMTLSSLRYRANCLLKWG